jgi:hypothetical protein
MPSELSLKPLQEKKRLEIYLQKLSRSKYTSIIFTEKF